MDDKLIRKLQEEDIFAAPGGKELKKRKTERPSFICPKCNAAIHDVICTLIIEPPSCVVPVTSGGSINTEEIDFVDEGYMPDQGSNRFNCTKCNADITEFIEEDY